MTKCSPTRAFILLVLVRTCGERTTEECIRRWEAFGHTVQVIKVSPFLEALRQTYLLGSQAPDPWFISCDADVLVDSDPKEEFRHNNIFANGVSHLNVLLFDWLYGKPRAAGLRMYKTECVEGLIPLIQPAVRPEARIVETYLQNQNTVSIYGTHDKHQWFRDVWRKAQHHAIKHKKHLPALIQYWNSQSHPDFQVALRSVANVANIADHQDARTFRYVGGEKKPMAQHHVATPK